METDVTDDMLDCDWHAEDRFSDSGGVTVCTDQDSSSSAFRFLQEIEFESSEELESDAFSWGK